MKILHVYIDYISRVVDDIHANFRVEVLSTALKNRNEIIELKIEPEAVISCLAGSDLEKIQKDSFVKMFGENAYTVAESINNMPCDYSGMCDFFKNHSESISYICLASATEVLKDTIKNADDYDDYDMDTMLGFLNQQINMGFATHISNKKNLKSNALFESYAAYYLPPIIEDFSPYKKHIPN